MTIFSKNPYLSSSPLCGYENPKKIGKNHGKFEEKRVKLKYEFFPYLASFLAEAHKDSSGGVLANKLELSPMCLDLDNPPRRRIGIKYVNIIILLNIQIK